MPKVAQAKTVLQEVLASGITHDHVKRRVKDWQARIAALYGELEEWLPKGWKAVKGRPVRMSERMMKAHKVPGVYLPCLELRGPKGRTIRIRPDCLWVVGFNGSIDVLTAAEYDASEHYIIVDVADILTPPKWRITAKYSPRREYRLNRQRLKWLLAMAKP